MKGDIIMLTILMYVLSIGLSWGIWWTIMHNYLTRKVPNIFQLMDFENHCIGIAMKKETKVIAWLRFIIWPYGILQRTIIIMKELKRFDEWLSLQKETV